MKTTKCSPRNRPTNLNLWLTNIRSLRSNKGQLEARIRNAPPSSKPDVILIVESKLGSKVSDIRIIDLPEDDLISHQIQPLGTRREVGALTLFHRVYYGEAPELLCQLLHEYLQLDPRLRRSVRLHDLAVQTPHSNLVSHKRSFVPSAARIWNSLPEYIPSLEKRACFKKEVNRYLGDN